MPNIIDEYNNNLRNEYLLELLTMNLIQTYRKFGIAPIDVLDAISQIRGRGCNPEYRFEDGEIDVGNRVFKVLNPPKIVKDKDIVDSVRDVIEEFRKLAGEFEELKKIYGFVKENSLVYKNIVKDDGKNKKYENSYNEYDKNSIGDILEKIKKK